MEKYADISNVMTICVNSEDGPWCAPVYFVYDKNFYFFSSPHSVHIVYGVLKNVSCSIFRDSDDIGEIMGVQMSGRIYEPGAVEKGKAGVKYIKKFGKIMGGKVSDTDSIEKLFKSRLYAFMPEYYVVTDNSKGFGSSHKIKKVIKNEL